MPEYGRWKLTEPHYLSVPGVRWEYVETDRKTGAPKRSPFPVPLYLNPIDINDLKRYGQMDPDFPSPQDEDRIIVVTNNPSPTNQDVTFEGEVTPGMLPLNAEARRITQEISKGKWEPTASTDRIAQENSYTNQLLSGLIDKMTDLRINQQPAAPVEGLQDLLKAMTAMMGQNQQILQALVANQRSAAEPRRKVG